VRRKPFPISIVGFAASAIPENEERPSHLVPSGIVVSWGKPLEFDVLSLKLVCKPDRAQPLMAQIFRPSADTYARMILGAAVLLVVALVLLGPAAGWSSYQSEVGWGVDQPVPFSHKHHVAGLGIDCRFCHATVETSAHAGFPSTHVCMTCHSQIWTGAKMLAPVRESLASGMPLVWNRVAKLPDYVFFNHSIHVSRGVACVECHGRVDTMPLLARAHPFEMRFCLDCHRDPAGRLGPTNQVTRMTPLAWDEATHRRFALAAAKRYHLDPNRLDKCDICHR